MKQYKEKMNGLLPNIINLNQDQIKNIITKYGLFVELLSFRSVMGYAYFWIKSEAGKEALIDNIDCEGKQSHQKMLNDFLEKCDALPNKNQQIVMRNSLKPARKVIQEYSIKESSFAHIVFLTLAENTSLEFIPWLAEGAKILGCDDFTYTDVHGEADIKHAILFEKAFYDEKNELGVSDEESNRIVNIYFDIMKTIFDPNI